MSNTREERRQETAAKVRTCASDLFQKQGFADTTIRDIAAWIIGIVGAIIALRAVYDLGWVGG